jgi:hypothetical protein
MNPSLLTMPIKMKKLFKICLFASISLFIAIAVLMVMGKGVFVGRCKIDTWRAALPAHGIVRALGFTFVHKGPEVAPEPSSALVAALTLVAAARKAEDSRAPSSRPHLHGHSRVPQQTVQLVLARG